MIQIEHLYKRYHHHKVLDWVLKDINLTIPRGVSVGVLGRNGAGKSTLLRLIAGMDTPERGTIRRDARVSWPMGLAGGFQGALSGRQNVKFVARVHGGGRDVGAIIDKVQEFAELGPAFDDPIRTYSSGMRARLNFGLSLAFDFDVYLSDEATSVGDRVFKAKATRAFKDRVNRASLVMVSHSEGILRELCQAGIYLKHGEAYWFDDIKDAIRAYHQDSDSKSSSRDGRGPSSVRPDARPAPAEPTAGIDTMSLEKLKALLDKRNKQLARIQRRLDALELGREDADELVDPRVRQDLAARLYLAKERLHEVRRAIQTKKRATPPISDDDSGEGSVGDSEKKSGKKAR
ncbi:ABC transporter ATP-binding protein [Halomonas sp. DN3]|uniref:ABC transporter ATP-binding protein n=1 Tax=Halomonas sp. DN3 TaxID=2953657 RepID=UPI00209DCAEF|nr:ABC transporter ATP-binding protein [Halomonas sp. DN3]USZ49670.1 ABC transporter ATP-binding protein [Halomonas sp. DN3]